MLILKLGDDQVTYRGRPSLASIVGMGLKEWYDVCGITEPIDSENFILTDYHARSYADDYNIRKQGLIL